MWILNYVTKNSISNSVAEKGNVKSVSDGHVQINASSEYAKIPIIAPYGITYAPIAGEESVVLQAGGENICLGTVSKNETLSPGELMLSSSGGATILLKNDGNVYINGKKVS
ncbi:MAG: phage baseplate assembly protein [Ruminococcus sp.]|nr:phage baseplate assembly protein [Ruminococcus sp.]